MEEEINKIRSVPESRHPENEKENEANVKDIKNHLENLRNRKRELQRIREKLADTIY
jgi:hypothetical protein